MAALVCGALACVPQSANAQGLWVGGWGWGGPMAMGGFGPGFGPGYGLGFGPAFGPGFGPAFGPAFGPRYVAPFSPVAWGYPGYPGYRPPFYGAAVYARPVYAPAVVAPVYAPVVVAPVYRPVVVAPVYRPAPVYVGPTAHAVRVGGRVARRSWRRGFGW